MKLHRLLLPSLLALVLSATAFAHGGHKHHYLGTVKTLHENYLVVATTEDGDKTFMLTESTKYTKDASAAAKADLKAGVRVSVHVENDGRTATEVKIAS